MEVRQAVLSTWENVPLCQAAGRVAAQAAGLYPPGIPQVCPGEIISEKTVRLLMEAGARQRFGLEGDTMLCVKR